NTISSLDAKLASLRIPFEDIVTATKYFAEENLLKHGEGADVYKGVLLLRSKVSINVVIRKFGHFSEYRSDARKFYDEIKIISGVKHRNIVCFIGFCGDKDERMIVMEHATNGGLDLHLSDPTFFTWLQRLQICFGVALALTYCYNDNNTRRYNMKGFKVLIDKDWEAKVQISIAFNSYDKTNPMYAFGVTLLEVLYGRKATAKDVDYYLTKMEKNHYEQLDDIIDPSLRQQMHPQSLLIFSDIAYYCLKEQPDKQHTYILKRLKEAFEIQWKHENLFLNYKIVALNKLTF
ncbi:putative receptor-like protein kinase At2g23200, partial [Bidens hawaiensis]